MWPFSNKKTGSIVRRMVVAKTTGLVVGLLGFFGVPYFWPDISDLLKISIQWGVLLWYATLGGIIGLFGVIDRHPYFGFRIHAVFRGVFIGAWMNFILAVLGYEMMNELFLEIQNMPFDVQNPLIWLPIEGAIVGLVIDLISTKFGGEGKGIL